MRSHTSNHHDLQPRSTSISLASAPDVEVPTTARIEAEFSLRNSSLFLTIQNLKGLKRRSSSCSRQGSTHHQYSTASIFLLAAAASEMWIGRARVWKCCHFNSFLAFDW
ncbi:hypothetical protein Vadar_016364 [Vaccinium darrowii]|uniref:Uncharacterized protein n=1 Tax=Vaccinium darrowii TaxID=229202 RepID=A0ACB7YF46_9ERIC|nr:hypothetical protein Vadar_016364 [Vaccinium darrowii]